MSFKTAFTAGLLGCSLCMASLPAAHSETLRVMNGSASTALNVPMNRAVVVESDQPFAELSIANPGIADISTLSDRSIYVLGKAPGRTTLTLLGPDGKLITNVDVQVTPDVAEFKERLKQILPNEKVEVRTANDGIVISGTVSSTAKLDRALDLAERYAPGRVSNLMNVGGEQQVMLKVRFAEMAREVSKELNGSIRENDQERACAVVRRIGMLGYPPRPVFETLLKYACSEEGALHAEKFYRTTSEEFAAARPAHKWRQLIALARVTASECNQPAAGYAEGCKLLGVG